MYLNDISQIRSIEWSKSHNWDIHFSDNSLNEFSQWFPASSIEEGLFSANNHTFEAAGLSFAVPKSQGLETIKITFLDSINLTVHEWLRKWVKETIYNHGRYVSRLGDTGVLKTVHITRVDNKHENLDKDGSLGKMSYQVFPQGIFHYIGDSEANPISNSVEFVIIAEIPES